MNDVVLVEERTVSMDSNGETVVWNPAQRRHAEVTPVSAQARVAYQQLNSVVTHRVVFKGLCTVRLGDHRFVWGEITLKPSMPPQTFHGNTVVMVQEC
jgi:D-hexose-6-phosphate mutarotase